MIVVKIGGASGVNLGAVCADIARAVGEGRKVVVVHGGSDATSTLSGQLGVPNKFITSPSGHTSRRTDRRTMEIFQMAVRGLFNQQIVECLTRLGVNAAGVSGIDGRTWVGERKTAIRAVEDGRTVIVRDDLSGTVETVNTALVGALLGAGFTPVLCPPALSTGGEPINVDADRAAAMTAAALGAPTLLLLSNVRGLYRDFPDETSLIPRISRDAVDEFMEFAQGRMKKKVLGAKDALSAGVRRVVIGDARGEAPLTRALAGEGTVFE